MSYHESDLHVVLAHDLTTVDDQDKPYCCGNSYPSAWFMSGMEADSFTQPGPRGNQYSDPIFRKHILGGLEWLFLKTANGFYKSTRTEPD